MLAAARAPLERNAPGNGKDTAMGPESGVFMTGLLVRLGGQVIDAVGHGVA